MPLMTKDEYVESLRKSKKRVFLGGEEIGNYVDHPMIRPSINSCAATYDLCSEAEYEDLMTARSSLTGKRINRFTRLHQGPEDLVKKVKMQRLFGAEDRVLLSAVRWLRRVQRGRLGNLRHGRGPGYGL